MQRRDALSLAASLLVAGCSGPPSELADGGSGGQSSSPAAEDGGSGDEPGQTGAETPASDGDGDSEQTSAHVGGTFTLAGVEYLVEGVWRADSLGSEMDEETAEGVFVIALITLTNGSDQHVGFPDTNLRLRQSGSWSYPSERLNGVAAADDRIAADAWTGGSVAPGSTRSGVAVWDAVPEAAADLWFLAHDESGEVLVPIGTPASLDFLSGVVTS